MPVRNDFAPGEFCWIDLAAHDLPSAATWYGDLFGWSHMLMDSPGEGAPPYAFFMQGEAAVAGLGQMSDEMKAQGIPPCWNSYIATPDCSAFEAKAQAAGATVTVPTTDVPGHGKLAFFLDPEGASFAAWETTTQSGPGVHLAEPVGLSWTELMTRDSAAAQAFYAELNGWEYASMPMGGVDYTMIKNAGQDAGGMMPMEGPQFEGVPAHWMVYFAVADCDATAAQASASGGRILLPPTEIPVGKFATLGDPQGGAFSVITVNDSAC